MEMALFVILDSERSICVLRGGFRFVSPHYNDTLPRFITLGHVLALSSHHSHTKLRTVTL